MDVVNQAWCEQTSHVEPCHVLFQKLRHTMNALMKCCQCIFSDTEVLVHAALLVVLHLDLAQESRVLSSNERDLRARLKKKVIVLAIVERARKKQSARNANIKKGDANTKFFHLSVNARRRKNYIQHIKHNNGWTTDHVAKEQVVHNHFNAVMGRGNACTVDLNWESISF
jgi:hypothetical protein